MNILEAYRALADESRLRIVHALSNGALNVQELTEILELSQSTISHHLKVLQQAKLVQSHKQGTWVYYSLEQGEASCGTLVSNCISHLSNHPITKINADKSRIRRVLNHRRETGKKYFEAVAKDWSALRSRSTGSSNYFSEVLKRIPSKATVLELGCGSGALLAKLLERPGKTIGVDYSQAMLDEAREALGSKVDLRLGELEHLPLGDERVDIAVSYMVMHHISHPVEALKDTLRVLKPGGELVIVDLMPHDNEAMREQFADFWLGFDPELFSTWVSDAGFTCPEFRILGKKKDVFFLTAKA